VHTGKDFGVAFGMQSKHSVRSYTGCQQERGHMASTGGIP
jgi:hypothetical protein